MMGGLWKCSKPRGLRRKVGNCLNLWKEEGCYMVR